MASFLVSEDKSWVKLRSTRIIEEIEKHAH